MCKATTPTHIALNLSRALCKTLYAAIESETELQTSDADKPAAVKHNYTRVPLILQCEKGTETVRSWRLTKHSLKRLSLQYFSMWERNYTTSNIFYTGIRIYCKMWRYDGEKMKSHTNAWSMQGTLELTHSPALLRWVQTSVLKKAIFSQI